MTRLLDKLAADLDKPCMLPHRENSELDKGLAVSELSLSDHEAGFLTDAERDAALTQLKTYGSDPKDADPLFTSKVRTYSSGLQLASTASRRRASLLKHRKLTLLPHRASKR